MTVFLETDRLIVNLTSLEDFENVLALRSDPDVQKYTAQGIQSKEKVERFFKIVIPYQEKHGHGMSSVFLKPDNKFIGQAGIFHIGHYDLQPEIEIGYRLHKMHWGNGYATELSKALLAWGFEHLFVDELIAFVEPENKASRRVLEKIGMNNIGLVTCHYGELEKCVISRMEWKNKNL